MMLRTCRAAVALMFVFLCVCFLKGLLVTSVSCPNFTKVPDTRFLLSLPFGLTESTWGVLPWFLTLKATCNFLCLGKAGPPRTWIINHQVLEQLNCPSIRLPLNCWRLKNLLAGLVAQLLLTVCCFMNLLTKCLVVAAAGDWNMPCCVLVQSRTPISASSRELNKT